MHSFILDLQVGDSGKGRITHDFSKNYDWAIRHSGSSNCGHTIYKNNKKYVHHLIPTANWDILTIKAFMGSGMMISPDDLIKEIKELSVDFPRILTNLIVDPDATAILPEHIAEDKAKNQHLATTWKGVGPAASARIGRSAPRLRDLIKDNHPVMIELQNMGIQFKTQLELREQFEKSNLLFEGAQGVLLDPWVGIYPYVTSTQTTPSGVSTSGFHWVKFDYIWGIFKPYITKSGAGPFPSEVTDNKADFLREKGKEWGATTGRPRRIGWLDLPALKYAIKQSGPTHLICTKLDILNKMDSVPVALEYAKEPTCGEDFKNAAITKWGTLPQWQDASSKEDISKFVSLVENQTSVKMFATTHGTSENDINYWHA